MERLTHQGIDSKAMLATYITRLPLFLLLAAVGAALGSGLCLLVAVAGAEGDIFVSETEFYIDFADGRFEARDYYNAFTWNDVIATDLILGEAMKTLGGGYDRDYVRGMVTAEMPSDVRYLTIFVRGEDPSQVAEVKDAVGEALSGFGGNMDEFDSIYKIEDLEIVKEERRYFTWRAAFLGAFVSLGAGVFATAAVFCMGSSFYTKNDIMEILGLPACGITFGGGRDSALVKRQLEMLEGNLGRLVSEYKRIAVMDADGGSTAGAFLEYIRQNGIENAAAFVPYDGKTGTGDGVMAAVLVAVPFGRTYREKITDEINYAVMRGAAVAAAVLVQADRNWMNIYYI